MYTFLLIVALALLIGYKYVYTQILSKKSIAKKIYIKLGIDVVLPACVIFISTFLVSIFVTRFVMVNDHEVLKESVESLQMGMERAKERGNKKSIDKLRSNEDNVKYAPVFGNPKGKIVVFEFMDYYCGHCKVVSKIVEAGLKDMPDVKFVLKPLTFMSPVSSIPAKAVIAAQKQGKADKLNSVMMSGNLMPDMTKIKSMSDQKKILAYAEKSVKDMILKMAKTVGIDTQQLSKDMDSKEVEEELLRTRELAQMLQINSTPNFVIGNKIHGGAFQSVEAFRQAVENAR